MWSTGFRTSLFRGYILGASNIYRMHVLIHPSVSTNHTEASCVHSITAVTFCGCGFLGVYLVGVATYMQQHTPKILRGRLGGSSVGSLIATCLACDVPLEVSKGPVGSGYTALELDVQTLVTAATTTLG